MILGGIHIHIMVNKKTKKNRIIVGGIFLALAIIIIFGSGVKLPFAISGTESNLYSEYGEGECSGGFTTLSISDVSISINGEGDNARIKVTGIAQGSECIRITLNDDALDSKLKSSGYEATKDIFMNIELIKDTETYPIQDVGDFIGVGVNKVIEKSGKFGSLEPTNCLSQPLNSMRTCLINWCKTTAGEPTSIFAYKTDTFSKVRCVTSTKYGDYGKITGEVNSDFRLKVSIGSQSRELSRSQQSVSFSDGHFVQYAGSLNGLDRLGQITYTSATLVGSQWQLIDGDINTFNSAVSNFKNSMSNKGASITDSSYDRDKQSFDETIKFIYNYKTSSYKNTLINSGLIFDMNTDRNNLYTTLRATSLPLITIDLNAKSVGIVRLQGKPVITDCVDAQNSLKSGVNKWVSFSVKNDANVNNVKFYGSVECGEGVTATFPAFQINAKETKTINMQLQSINLNTNDLKGNCVITIRDLASDNSATCSFSTNVEYNSGITCSAGQNYCFGGNVVKCNEKGDNYILIESCDNGCESPRGIPQCKKTPGDEICDNGIDDDGDGLIDNDDPDCKGILVCESGQDYVVSKLFSKIIKSLECKPTLAQKLGFPFALLKFLLIPLALILCVNSIISLFNCCLFKNSIKSLFPDSTPK